MGRTFQEGDDQPGKDHLVILSHSLWERRFGSDPNIVGRSILLEGISRQVVGVMPPDFRYPSPKAELWVPLDLNTTNLGDYWGSSYIPVFARLRPGVTIQEARTELAQIQEAMVGDVRARLLIRGRRFRSALSDGVSESTGSSPI